MNKSTSNTRVIFYSLWCISLLLQAYFTEITSDEAYYWIYSKQLAFGYFDHPPIIAILIKLGYAVFSNELGVRLIPIILSTLSIMVMERLIEPKKLKSFFMLVSSVGILHFMGFFALPDSPFMFAFAIYLMVYKKFIHHSTVQNSLLLGGIIAVMCLSKYHSIIIVCLTVLSNLKLLKRKHFWITACTTIMLLIPHFLWQIIAGFPSVKYHLFERSTSGYELRYSLEYVFLQLFVLGPLTGFLFIIAAIKQKTEDQFEKTLKFMIWGGYLFFFLMTFKGRVEGHWTFFILLPSLYFGYHFLVRLNNYKRLTIYMFSISLFLIFTAKALISIDFKLEENSLIARITKPFRNKDTMLAIQEPAGERVVAFMNSYQKASLYSFYTGLEAFSLNNIMGRKNQFDILNVEDKYRGEEIMLIPNYESPEMKRIQDIPEKIRYTFIKNFQSFSKIKITASALKNVATPSDTLNLTITLTNTKGNTPDINANQDYPSYIHCLFFQGRKLIKDERAFRVNNDMLNEHLKLDVIVPEKEGEYDLFFTIKTGWLPSTINSEKFEINVHNTSYYIKMKEGN